MKKLVLIISLFSFFLSNAQPVPACAKSSIKKRLFLTCNYKDTLLYKTDTKVHETLSSVESCFRIRDIKDLGVMYQMCWWCKKANNIYKREQILVNKKITFGLFFYFYEV
jgi:hypothetical protein